MISFSASYQEMHILPTASWLTFHLLSHCLTSMQVPCNTCAWHWNKHEGGILSLGAGREGCWHGSVGWHDSGIAIWKYIDFLHRYAWTSIFIFTTRGNFLKDPFFCIWQMGLKCWKDFWSVWRNHFGLGNNPVASMLGFRHCESGYLAEPTILRSRPSENLWTWEY